ncbi:MAG: energy transducer TonB [Acidobacteria bacterium]|nr:energy transducer TonB [Acidobacteriota bacterium]MBA4185131.1 energy transducer TonB [Acidobacteriota bacterium]
MGKIVKYCAACDESFAERFGFCPNCGQAMTAFEMNPLNNEPKLADEVERSVENEETVGADEILAVPAPAHSLPETTPSIETSNVARTQDFSTAGQAQTFFDDTKTEVFATDNFAPETKTFAGAAGANSGEYQTTNNNQSLKDSVDDSGYHITVIEEKNVKQRNVLLLGSLALMVTLALGGTVYSLFNRDLMIGAIGEDDPLYVSAIDEVPMEVEEQPKAKNDKDAGGGGGGGRDRPTETSKGQLATQTKDPIMAPSVTNVKKDFDLQMQASTQGTKNIKQTNDPYGNPNSKYTLSSDGTGTGGGQGSGVGTGQGSGRGTGQGSGIGSGSGSGTGDGNGPGTGSGNAGGLRTPPAPPPPRPAGVSQDVKIISKPGAKYTDAARQNQFSGTVRLRVTFTASGQIGSVSAVGSLPYGLTEQAIAAAKSIRFEPAKKDGVPITKIKQIDYSFTLY